MKKTFSFDRYDDLFGVFLLREDESKQLLIPKNLIDSSIKEGDIVEIQKMENNYEIVLLQEETKQRKDNVSSLLEQLRNNNK
jgi:bifunctional DNA-binding transcriptional regulator/antitoxin component of YhaV-PrlF toxin-antitoxin module